MKLLVDQRRSSPSGLYNELYVIIIKCTADQVFEIIFNCSCVSITIYWIRSQYSWNQIWNGENV